MANVPAKTKDVVLVFERPLEPESPLPGRAARLSSRGSSLGTFSPLTEDDLDGLFGSKRGRAGTGTG